MRPKFLTVILKHVEPGYWFTCSELAGMVWARRTVERSREASRKMANLERYGHLRRRKRGRVFEYSLPPEPSRFDLHSWPPTRSNADSLLVEVAT